MNFTSGRHNGTSLHPTASLYGRTIFGGNLGFDPSMASNLQMLLQKNDTSQAPTDFSQITPDQITQLKQILGLS